MNRNKIAALIFAVSTVCVVSAHSENAYATEHKNSNQLEENNQTRSVKKGQVINVSTNLRIRKSPNTSSDVIGYLTNGEIFNIDGKEGSWYKINANGKVGYIHGDYVKEVTGNSNSSSNNSGSNSNLDTSLAGKKGTVVNVSTSLRVRQSPSTSSSVVGSLRGGQTFEIKGKSGSWYYINANGLTGYIHGDYVQVGENSSNNGGQSSGNNGQSSENNSGMDTSLAGKTGYLHEDYVKIVSSNEGSNGGVNENLGSSQNGSTGGGQVNQSKYEQVLSIMKSQIGSPYIYGGAGETLTSSLLSSLRRTFPDHAARGFYDIPSNYLNGNYRAFDCSGLMQWSFRQAGISLGRTTWDQINNGYEVSPSNAKPGDLLFFSNLGHVGMYIGNGQWIEAPNKGKFVSITSVPWSKIGRARRVL